MNIEMFYALAFSTILLYIWFKMQVTNEQKLKKILDANIGYITRQQVDEQGLSWFKH